MKQNPLMPTVAQIKAYRYRVGDMGLSALPALYSKIMALDAPTIAEKIMLQRDFRSIFDRCDDAFKLA